MWTSTSPEEQARRRLSSTQWTSARPRSPSSFSYLFPPSPPALQPPRSSLLPPLTINEPSPPSSIETSSDRSTSPPSLSVCWLCRREGRDDCRSYKRMEFSDPHLSGNGAVYRYGRLICEGCVRWCEEGMVEGGEFAQRAREMEELEWTIWVTRRMLEHGLTKRKELVMESGGRRGILAEEGERTRKQSPDGDLPSEAESTTFVKSIKHKSPTLESIKRASESQLEPSSLKKPKVESNAVASGSFPSPFLPQNLETIQESPPLSSPPKNQFPSPQATSTSLQEHRSRTVAVPVASDSASSFFFSVFRELKPKIYHSFVNGKIYASTFRDL